MTAKDALKLAGDDLAITVNDGGPQALRRRSSFMDTIKGELLADSEADTAAKESKVSTDFSEEHARGSWVTSIYHVITTFIGAGVLALPWTIGQVGWWGIALLAGCILASFHSACILANLHIINGRRIGSYRQLSMEVLGPRAGYWAVFPFQLIVCCGQGVKYLVAAGKSFAKVYQVNCVAGACVPMRTSYWIAVATVIQIILSQLPDFHSIWMVSLVGAVASICYCLLGTIAPPLQGHMGSTAAAAAAAAAGPVSYAPAYDSSVQWMWAVFLVIGALGDTCGGQTLLPEIQATLSSTKPPGPVRGMMWCNYISFTAILLGYMGVAVSGFATYGVAVQDNVLLMLDNSAMATVANILVAMHVVASWQVYSRVVFNYLELALQRRFGPFQRPWLVWLFTRTGYVLVCGMVGMLVPFFGLMMSFLGAFGFIPTSFVLPSVLLLCSGKPLKPWYRALNWFLVVFFSLSTLMAGVTSLRDIVVSVGSNTQMFQ